VAGRYNLPQIDLSDQLGGALTGNHTFSRFNPAGGLTYEIRPGFTTYASYADANRAPTPAELACSSAVSPCSLANFFTGDPNLQQVVLHTIEAGLRSQFRPLEGRQPASRGGACANAPAIASKAGLGPRSASNGSGREAVSSVRHFAW
jgi:outer membrane receptor protein involved in Fe transport